MRKLSLIATSGLVTMALLGAGVRAHEISYDYDRHADFSKIKTFTFNKEGPNSGSPLVDDRIFKAIASELSLRGLTQNAEDPDVYVVPRMTFDTRRDVTAYTTGYAPFGGWYYWGGGWATTEYQVNDILMGTLTIDMVDADSGATIWRGAGTTEVKQHRKPSSLDRRTSETVAKIFKNFPPGRTT